MTELDIRCRAADDGDGWTCHVTVSVESGPTTDHRVRVRQADLDRLAPGAPDPYLLVDQSFRFLLAREPSTSILRSFDLPDIGRYFPEYQSVIRSG
jgi:hypothetical protein